MKGKNRKGRRPKHLKRSAASAKNKGKQSNNKQGTDEEQNQAQVAPEVTEAPQGGESTQLAYGVVGLANMRNTCYFNSVVQVLVASTRLQDHYGDTSQTWESTQDGALASGLRDCFKAAQNRGRLKSGKSNAFRPCELLDAVGKVCPAFKDRRQHDAHELMTALIQELMDEEVKCSRSQKNVEDTFASGAFSGKFGLSLSCQKCGHVKSDEESFFGISLPIVKAATSQKSGCGSTEEQGQSGKPCAAPVPVRKVVVGSVVERNDEQSKSNLLGGTSGACEKESTSHNSPGTSEYVKVTIDEHGVALEVVLRPNGGIVEQTKEESEGGQISSRDDGGGHVQLSTRDEQQSSTELKLRSGDSIEQVSENESKVTVSGKGNEEVDSQDQRQTPSSSVPMTAMEKDEDDEDGFIQVRKKGKKGRKNRHKTHDVVERAPSQSDACALTTVDDCFEEYFSPEVVHWRCPKEYPEKRIQISEDEPEVFYVPRKDSFEDVDEETASGCSETDDAGGASEEVDSGSKQQDQEKKPLTLPLPSPQGLKSCLKDPPKLNSVKQYKIQTLPNILVVHLKRFEVNKWGSLKKLGQHVKFDRELAMDKFCEHQGSCVDAPRYSLRGTICHKGTIMGGHYVAYVLRSSDANQWFFVSDHDVQHVKEADVLASQAYILVYELVQEEPEGECTDGVPPVEPPPGEDSSSVVSAGDDKDSKATNGLVQEDADISTVHSEHSICSAVEPGCLVQV